MTLTELPRDGFFLVGMVPLLKTLWAFAVVGAITATVGYGTGHFPVYAAARSQVNSPPDTSASDPASAAGMKVFQANCAVCHGENRQGHPPMFPSLVGVGTRLTTEQITATIHNGKGAMPSFAKITDPDLSNLIHYLTASDKPAATPPRATSHPGGPGTTRPPRAGWRTT